MSAEILGGKSLAEEMKERISQEIRDLDLQPTLATILVGKDPASKLYMELQAEACEEVGIIPEKHFLESSVPQSQLIELIRDLNTDETVHGILIQLPLPERINTVKVIREIDPVKDVDGVTPFNLGKILEGDEEIVPATPKGILHLLDHYGIDFKGKNVVIVNHSVVVGKPLSMLFLNRDATVSVCHEFTGDLSFYTRHADILISAAGVPNLIKPEMIREGAVVIDAGISRKGGKVVGDVEYKKVKQKASYVSPVPGGVGPMTIASLLENILYVYKKQRHQKEA